MVATRFGLFETTKIQIFKAIHNYRNRLFARLLLFETTKIQIFKAIHNKNELLEFPCRTV